MREHITKQSIYHDNPLVLLTLLAEYDKIYNINFKQCSMTMINIVVRMQIK